MKCPHVYVPAQLAAGQQLQLPAETAHHLRVLRVRVGDSLRLFNGDGAEYPARLLSAQRREAAVLVEACEQVCRESPLAVTLVQGVSKGERMDYTIQKAVELGVARIVPVLTARSVVQLDGGRAEKRRAHWQGVIVAACEQSERNRIPEITPPVPLAAAWGLVEAPMKLVLDPQGELTLARAAVSPSIAAALLVGPEGGLTDAEIAEASARGFARLRMGPRVLRTETAAVAALAALQTLAGDFG